MPEAVWNGFLRLSLVSCPVRLAPATSDAHNIRLDQLNSRTGNPVAEQFVDAGDRVCGLPVVIEELLLCHVLVGGNLLPKRAAEELAMDERLVIDPSRGDEPCIREPVPGQLTR